MKLTFEMDKSKAAKKTVQITGEKGGFVCFSDPESVHLHPGDFMCSEINYYTIAIKNMLNNYLKRYFKRYLRARDGDKPPFEIFKTQVLDIKLQPFLFSVEISIGENRFHIPKSARPVNVYAIKNVCHASFLIDPEDDLNQMEDKWIFGATELTSSIETENPTFLGTCIRDSFYGVLHAYTS